VKIKKSQIKKAQIKKVQTDAVKVEYSLMTNNNYLIENT
jgi:hypothetical protein